MSEGGEGKNSPIRLQYSGYKTGLNNFGDMLSPVIVAAFTGRHVQAVPSSGLGARLVAIGTIGQIQRFGHATFWGTGIGDVEDYFRVGRGFRRPSFTKLSATALRGPFSAAMFRAAGLDSPSVFGDPGLLVSRLWADLRPTKRYELGVYLHVSEVTSKAPDATPNTYVSANLAALREKVKEILACKRILSTGLHAQILAEAYGIPCATFDIHEGSSGLMAPDDETQPFDHRMRDFYAGIGVSRAPVFRQPRHLRTDWEAAIRFIDDHWTPKTFDTTRLIEAFPSGYGPVRAEPLLEGLEGRLGWERWAA
jgi:hypothetical protein